MGPHVTKEILYSKGTIIQVKKEPTQLTKSSQLYIWQRVSIQNIQKQSKPQKLNTKKSNNLIKN